MMKFRMEKIKNFQTANQLHLLKINKGCFDQGDGRNMVTRGPWDCTCTQTKAGHPCREADRKRWVSCIAVSRLQRTSSSESASRLGPVTVLMFSDEGC